MRYQFWPVFWKEMIKFFRFKSLLFTSLVQPALWMAFFGTAMSSNFDRLSVLYSIPSGAGQVGYLTFMGAGVIAMTALFTSLYGGMTLIYDKNFGLMKEMIASPMQRTQIVLGLGLSGVTKGFIQAIIIMVFGAFLGVNFFSELDIPGIACSVLGILLFVGTFSLGFIFLSSGIALRLETHEGMQGIMTVLSMPLFFVSNALYPVDAFPALLKALSVINPLTYLVNGIRYFAIGDDFYALGKHYIYTSEIVSGSYVALLIFTLCTFIFAMNAINNVRIT
jgi:ABC-2 type transport system permease protein